MAEFSLPDIAPALSEIILAAGAMALLIFGAVSGEKSTRTVSWLAIAVLIIALAVSLAQGGERHLGFYGMFVTDAFALFMKALVLIGSAVTILTGMRYNEDQGIARFEFPVLILLSTAGMLVMISANDLITLYVGLELQNLALYVVASFNRDSARSSEAGLKYFVLGALSSGMLLYGASLLYGFTGTTAFSEIATLVAGGAAPSIGHVGYALIGLATGTAAGIRGVLVYMAIYLFMTVGTWAVILCMRRNGRMLEGISDLAGLSRSQPGLALALAIFMFALSGIPPTAGFFAKLYVFLAAIDAKLAGLAVIGVVTSVVSAFYYLRVVKVMYFDEPVGAFDRPLTAELKGVLFVTAVATLFFFILPGPIVGGADAAALALFAR